MVDETVQTLDGSSCFSCRLKLVAHVRLVNLSILVADNDMWTRTGSVVVSVIGIVFYGCQYIMSIHVQSTDC